MKMTTLPLRIVAGLGLSLLSALTPLPATVAPTSSAEASAQIETELAPKLDADSRVRLHRGLGQIASFWRESDGDGDVLTAFVREHFAATPTDRDILFARFEKLLEQINGGYGQIGTALRWQTDIESGPVLPVDRLLAGYDPGAHFIEDSFNNKIAFVVLLNFPLTTLAERDAAGAGWSRRQWAEVRLAQQFSKRIPASVNLEAARALSAAEGYIAGYNIWMHHLVDERGQRLFPAKLRLLSHWNLRDEIKACYPQGPSGLARQRMIVQVMDRIVTQTIPAAVVDNPGVDWNPVTNAVAPAAVNDGPAKAGVTVSDRAEPDTRYARLLDTFHAAQLLDPWSPTAPTLIARRFEEMRELSETRVRGMIEQVLTSPLVPRVAAVVSHRLGRPLEPFDIWYNGFRPPSTRSADELDRLVAARYPTPEAFESDMPRLLGGLGFSPETAAYLAARIAVDPARGSGHAHPPEMRGAKARLRTRIGPGGMDYKGYNIAVHEFGHNVEQTVSLNEVDHTLLAGVPNNAFTEAIAFVFQARDLDLLGVAPPANALAEADASLDDFWSAWEIAGVALLDLEIWHWMYAHPAATPAELKTAMLSLSREIWNRYYGPVLGQRDSSLLAIYSHILGYQMYVPDYFLGSLIAKQIEEQVKQVKAVGPEIERMAKFGSVAPDLWMKNATGSPVSTEALLKAAEHALPLVE